jgi:voltage-gated potassium channel
MKAQVLARRFEIPMLIASGLTVPCLVAEAVGVSGPEVLVLNYAIWTAFLIETVVMLWVVPNRWQWVCRHPLDVVVVVLTPPFLLAALQPLRTLRLLRLLRLARLGPLLQRLMTQEGLRGAALFAALVALSGAIAFHLVEKGQSLGASLYWAVTTMSTVGYGDVSAHTQVGRAISLVVMFVGIGLVALLTGAIAERFLRTSRTTPPRELRGTSTSSIRTTYDVS